MIVDTALHALRVFGPERQLRKAAEECAECSAAIIRYIDDPEGADHAAEECADVEIMMIQVREIIGNELVNKWKAKKAERLHDRLKVVEAKAAKTK
jgi:NTP pyrophosphatase (non-canonical NTP hydrolase)